MFPTLHLHFLRATPAQVGVGRFYLHLRVRILTTDLLVIFCFSHKVAKPEFFLH